MRRRSGPEEARAATSSSSSIDRDAGGGRAPRAAGGTGATTTTRLDAGRDCRPRETIVVVRDELKKLRFRPRMAGMKFRCIGRKGLSVFPDDGPRGGGSGLSLPCVDFDLCLPEGQDEMCSVADIFLFTPERFHFTFRLTILLCFLDVCCYYHVVVQIGAARSDQGLSIEVLDRISLNVDTRASLVFFEARTSTYRQYSLTRRFYKLLILQKVHSTGICRQTPSAQEQDAFVREVVRRSILWIGWLSLLGRSWRERAERKERGEGEGSRCWWRANRCEQKHIESDNLRHGFRSCSLNPCMFQVWVA